MKSCNGINTRPLTSSRTITVNLIRWMKNLVKKIYHHRQYVDRWKKKTLKISENNSNKKYSELKMFTKNLRISYLTEVIKYFMNFVFLKY